MASVAIIIPCFNQAHYVGQAVSSSLAQTHADVDVIVIDDGSADDVPGALTEWRDDPRLRVIRQENAGVGAARNTGLARTQAPFVMFLDADDYLHPEKIASQLEALADERAGLALCDITAVGGPPESETVTVNFERLERDNLLTALLAGGLFPPCVPLVRTELVRQAGGFDIDRALSGHADWSLWLRLGAIGVRHAIVRERLACYRLHPDGMSQNRRHMTESRRLVLERLAAAYPEALAAALSELGERHQDAWHAVRWMRESMARALQHTDALAASLAAVQGELAAAHAARFAEAEARERAEQRAALLEELQAPARGEVVIWGCGAKGREALALLRTRGVDVGGWLDSDASKRHLPIEGLPVRDPRAWLSSARQGPPGERVPLVVIASMHYRDIRPSLRALAAEAGAQIRDAVFP
jgi:GT2 family glycosyltransferase